MATAQGLPEPDRDRLEQAAESAATRLVRRIIDAVLRIVRGAPNPQTIDPVVDTAIVAPMWAEGATVVLAPIVADTWAAAAAATAADFVAAGLTPSILGPDRGAAYLSEATNRLVGIGDTLWDLIAQSLAQGMDVGEGIPELAARIRQIVPVTEGRATRIARTEVISASNAGSFAQAQALGDPTMAKIWQATNDDRTRETHREADGQRQPLLEAFIVGGWPLMFPGDPIGPPEEVINCRCTQTYDFGPEATLTASGDSGWDIITHHPLTAAAETHTGAMIALAPSVEDAYRLEVSEPAEQLHATLVYLGDDVNLTPDQRAALLEWASNVASGGVPLTLDGFAIATFNPNDPDRDTAVVLLLSGGKDDSGPGLTELRELAVDGARSIVGEASWTQQHDPYMPHVTLAYTDDPDLPQQLRRLTGAPVTFDHLRVAFGGDVHDFPLGGAEQDGDGWDVQVAAAKRAVKNAVFEGKHDRDSKGRFATMESRLANALNQGGDNPLSGFTREQLRRHGTQKLGLKFARGESEDSIRDKVAAALKTGDGGKKDTSAEAPAPKKAAPHRKTPAKTPEPTATVEETAPEVPTVKPTASTAGRSRGKVQDLKPGDVTRYPLRVTKVIDNGGPYIYVNGMFSGRELQERYERDKEIDFFRPTPEEIARDKEPREHFDALDDPAFENNVFTKGPVANVLEDLHQGRTSREKAATDLRDSAEYLREVADRNAESGNPERVPEITAAADALDRLAGEIEAKRPEPDKPEPEIETPETPEVEDSQLARAQKVIDDLDRIYLDAANNPDLVSGARREAEAYLDGLSLSAPEMRDLAAMVGVTPPPRSSKTDVRDSLVTRFVGSRLAARAVAGETSPALPTLARARALPVKGARKAAAPRVPAEPKTARVPRAPVVFEGDAQAILGDIRAIRDRGIEGRTADARQEAADYIDGLKLSAPQQLALARELGIHPAANRRSKAEVRDQITLHYVQRPVDAAVFSRVDMRAGVPSGPVERVEPEPPSASGPSLSQARAEVAAIAASPLQGTSRQGGAMGLTVREYRDRGQIIRKNTDHGESRSVRDPVEQADAEELAPLVAEALGLRAPAVVRSGDTEVEMEFIDGDTGAEVLPWGDDDPTNDMLRSHDGQRIGLLDYVIQNPDRNSGNYIMTPDGRIVPIDHGLAFDPDNSASTRFRSGDEFLITASEAADMRARIESLRPRFAAVGRESWLDETLFWFDLANFNEGVTASAATIVAEW